MASYQQIITVFTWHTVTFGVTNKIRLSIYIWLLVTRSVTIPILLSVNIWETINILPTKNTAAYCNCMTSRFYIQSCELMAHCRFLMASYRQIITVFTWHTVMIGVTDCIKLSIDIWLLVTRSVTIPVLLSVNIWETIYILVTENMWLAVTICRAAFTFKVVNLWHTVYFRGRATDRS
jgi:hypothetical protein